MTTAKTAGQIQWEAYRDAVLSETHPGCPTYLKDVVAGNEGLEQLWYDDVSVSAAVYELEHRQVCRRADRNA